MTKEEIYESMQEIKSQISCLANISSNTGKDSDYGFYLIMTKLSD